MQWIKLTDESDGDQVVTIYLEGGIRKSVAESCVYDGEKYEAPDGSERRLRFFEPTFHKHPRNLENY